MYGPLLDQRVVTQRAHGFHGGCVGHAHLCGHIGHAVYVPVPHYILYVYVVAHQRFLVVVDVYDTHQAVALQPEVVQECGVLTKGIVAVVRKIGRRLIVAE